MAFSSLSFRVAHTPERKKGTFLPMTENDRVRRVREILAAVKPLAVEYYQSTGKPLCVTSGSPERRSIDEGKLPHALPRP
jgi:hypothetical protein